MLVAVSVVSALALTGLLALQDRENAAAASPARANAARDALAYAGLMQVSRTVELAAALQRDGVLGLQGIGLRDFQAVVVGRLGGTIVATPGQWTLALGGGWACLTWPPSIGVRAPVVSRGVCSGAPIVVTPAVSAAALARAVRCTERRQQAALDAAVAAVSLSTQGAEPRFSVHSLLVHFRQLSDLDFRARPTPSGVTVMSKTSEACLRPTSTGQLAQVALGPCR